MKEMIGTVLALLRKYNRLWVVNLAMIGVLALCITALVTSMYELAACSCFLILLCTWEISDVFAFEKYAALKEDLANTNDKLVIAEHKVERLQLELETTQAALLDAKSKKQCSCIQTGLDQVEVENKAESMGAVETAVVDAASASTPEFKPKTKRSSFKRKPKPKQTENVNENKD